jgi:hypothetical protein
MDKTATTENLILYYYNETPLAETVIIQKEIDHDPETELEFEILKSAMQKLDDLLCFPSQKCVDSILNYSRNTVGV